MIKNKVFLLVTASAVGCFLILGAASVTNASPWPYAPGTVLDPGCLPTDLTCTVTSVSAVSNGGTGQTTYTDGQLLIGNSSNNGLTKATLQGTSNEITVTNGNGSITLSTPQAIGTASTPIFASTTLSNFTAGSIPFFTTGGSLNQNNAGLFWDNVNGRLGIGTSSPQGLLDIVGSSNSTSTLFTGARAVSLINTDTTNGNMAGFDFRTDDTNGVLTTGTKILSIFNSHAAGAVSADLAFRLNNSGLMSEVMRITGTGFVGIGSSSPSAVLSVEGTSTTASTTNLFSVASSTGTSLFSILSGGNVGIGTSTPSSLLYVNGQAAASYFTAASTTAASTFPAISVNSISGAAGEGISTGTSTNGLIGISQNKLWSSQGAAWDWYTNFDENDQAASSTIKWNTLPGPEQLDTSQNGTVAVSNHVAILQSAWNGSGGTKVLLSGDATIVNTPGKAFVVCGYLPNSQVSFTNHNTDLAIGWNSSSYTYQTSFPQNYIGIGDPNSNSSSTNILIGDNGSSSSNWQIAFRSGISPGDTFCTASVLTANGVDEYMQGGLFQQFGAYVGSSNWYPVYTGTQGAMAGNLFPTISAMYGTQFVIGFMGVASNLVNSSDAAILGQSTTANDFHASSIAQDADGSIWASWQQGTGDTVGSQDFVAHRNLNGQWSAPLLVASSTGSITYNASTLSLINGKMWLVLVNSNDGYVNNAVSTYQFVTANANNVISTTTMPSAFTGMVSNFGMIYTHPVVTSTGRIIFAVTSNASPAGWYTVYSDNGGSTWTEGTHYTQYWDEPQPAIDPNGTLEMYLRTEAGGTPYMGISSSTDSGVTWSVPVATSVSNSQARVMSYKMKNGDNFIMTNEYPGVVNYLDRPNVTGYILGNNATVLEKIPLVNMGPLQYLNGTQSHGGRLNYPDGIIDGNKVTFIYADQDAIGRATVLSVDIDAAAKNSASQSMTNINGKLTSANTGVNPFYMLSVTSTSTFSGLVGIGTTSPSANLAIQNNYGSTNTTLFAIASSTSANNSTSSTLFSISNTGVFTASTTNASNATSTINGNLYVHGALRSTTSYNGDLFFANNFSFTEAPLLGTPQGLLLKNQNGAQILSIDDAGNLTIPGDICANGAQCFGKSLSALSADLSALSASTSLSLSATTETGQSLSELSDSMASTSQSLTLLSAQVDALSSTTAMLQSALATSTLASTTASTLSASQSFIQAIANAVQNLIQSTGNWVINQITATLGVFDRVQTKELCIDDTCITNDQLKQILKNENVAAAAIPLPPSASEAVYSGGSSTTTSQDAISATTTMDDSAATSSPTASTTIDMTQSTTTVSTASTTSASSTMPPTTPPTTPSTSTPAVITSPAPETPPVSEQASSDSSPADAASTTTGQ
jgi:hypothetical protein